MIERIELYLQAPSLCFMMNEALLIQNLELLATVQERTGCRILLARKALSMFSLYPLTGKYLGGATASGLCGARLGFEEIGKENHVFSPTYRDEEFDEITRICGHVVFNPFSQWQKFGGRAPAAGCECGVRINPECSTQDHAIYDPCSPGSQLGVTAANFHPELLEGISGLHFHTLCEQDADTLERILDAVEEKFGAYLSQMKWLNSSGEHHISHPGYDVEKPISLVDRIQQCYGTWVCLEPGETVALNADLLVYTVLEIVENSIASTILDTSAAYHMPDMLEMPYHPPLPGVGFLEGKPHCYRLGGSTCPADDIIGNYSFNRPLAPGDRLIFGDMTHYSMVRTDTSNGMTLPSIAILDQSGKLRVQKTFGCGDFKGRLS